MYFEDLAEVEKGVRAVGWLEGGRGYTKGRISQQFFDTLVELMRRPLFVSCGFHICDLGWCLSPISGPLRFSYGNRSFYLGTHEIYVPGEDAVYWVPSLVLHYIRKHKYAPPPSFCDAVLACPEVGGEEYISLMERHSQDLAQRWRSHKPFELTEEE